MKIAEICWKWLVKIAKIDQIHEKMLKNAKYCRKMLHIARLSEIAENCWKLLQIVGNC